MADYIESTMDAPSASGSDSALASRSMLNEVNSDRAASQSSKGNDQTLAGKVSDKINDMFGSLSIIGDDKKEQTSMLDATKAKFSFGDSSDEDKQALRDFVKKIREEVDKSIQKDKADEASEPAKKAQVEKDLDLIKDDKAKEQFKKDMDAFEHRTPPVSTAERARFYGELTRLMEAGDNANSPLKSDDRLKLAQEIMHKAADPTTIDQGLNGTCNVATVESRTFTRDPSLAAKVIVDVATTGEYTAPDGTKVKPDPGSIKPDIEVQNPGNYFKNPRDHADQIFQVTAVNTVWQTHDLQVHDATGKIVTYPKGTVEYRETDPVTGQLNGEGLYDKSKNPPQLITDYGKPVNHPHIDGNQITDVSNTITGRAEKGFVIEHSGDGQAEKTVKVSSEQELKDKLKEMKENGQLPAIVMVNTGNSPFWGENVSLKAGALPKSGAHGEHVVTITDYDPKTGIVSMDNQWGKGRDHTGGSGISTGDLYIATLPPGSPETIGILERDVKWNRDHDTVNTFKELELLRQKKEGQRLTEDEYKEQVEKAMEDARKRWAAKGIKEDDVERQQAEEQYAKIQKSLQKFHTTTIVQ